MKIGFKEDRLIFEAPGGPTRNAAVSAEESVPVVAPAEAPVAPPIAEKADVKVDASKKREEMKTVQELDQLKKKMSGDFQEIATEVKLVKGQIFQGEFSLDKNFNVDTLVDKFQGEVVTNLQRVLVPTQGDPRLPKLTQKINEYLKKDDGKDFDGVDVANFLANLYSIDAKKSLKDEIEKIKLVEFIKDSSTTYPMNFEVNLDQPPPATSVSSKDPNSTFNADYEKWKKNHQESFTATDEEQKADAERMKRAKEFRSSIYGKAFAWLGFISVEEPVEGESKDDAKAREERNDAQFASALHGDNGPVKWIIHWLGGGAMIDGGTDDVEAALADVDPKFKPIVDSAKKAAKTLPFNMGKFAQKLAAPVVEALGMKVEDFDAAVKDNKKLTGKPFKLSEEYKSGDKGLKIVLADGAKMILPEGKTLNVGHEPIKAEGKDGKVFDNTITVTGDIPVGTTFRGNVKFEIPGEKKPDDKAVAGVKNDESATAEATEKYGA